MLEIVKMNMLNQLLPLELDQKDFVLLTKVCHEQISIFFWSNSFDAPHLITTMDITICWPSPSNQNFYRQIAGYQRGVGDSH